MKVGIFVFLMVFLGFTLSISAQYQNTSEKKHDKSIVKKPAPQPDRWFVGGMIGGGFSSYNSYVEISPIVGYHITPALDIGTRITYIYQGYTDPFGIKHNNHIYGMGIFSRFRFLKFLMAHIEYSGLSTKWYDDTRYFVNSLYVGGGLYQSVGRAGFATVTILYDLFEDEHSPYNNPIVRVGFGVGF
jgi:hypothetical protein